MESFPKPEKPKLSEEIIEQLRNMSVGQELVMKGVKYTIEKVEEASELGKQFGLKIERHVPVYHMDGLNSGAQGGYQVEADVVMVFGNNTDATTLEHELIHVVEYKFEPTQGLQALYDRAKTVITEESFDGDFVSFNFMKNIHEFIADGRTKLKPVLQKVGLYDDFVQETAYIFET